jgi:uncharacterized repeat protein (TIGR01451 family)
MTDLDYSGVDSSEPGTYSYTVTCGDGVSPDTDTGKVTVLPEPTADFTADKTSGCAPLTVLFTDQSTGNPRSWSWRFGDGVTSTEQNPSHTYDSPGTYEVRLTVTNDCGSDTDLGYITAIECVGPSLTIIKTDDPDPVNAGDILTYTITVTNSGNATATGVTIVDDYDETVLTIIDADGGFDDGYTITWDGGISIPAGDSISYTITATVDPMAPGGTIIINTASVSSSDGPGPSDTVDTTVSSNLPILDIEKTDDPDPVEPGENVTYNITVTNTGSVAATGVTVVDDYDETVLTIIDADGGFDDGYTITWDGGISIAAGDSISYTIIATVSSGADRGSTFYNTADVTCDEGPSDSDTESTDVATIPVTPAGGGGGGGCPQTKYLTVDWEGNNTTKPLYSNDRLTVDLLGPSSDLSHSLLLERGTLAPTVGRKLHYLIVVRELEETEIPPLADNTIALVVFNITPVGAVFDRDIFLTLGLNQTQLPANALNVTMASYDDVNGVWVPLEYEAGNNTVAELTLSAPINHFSIFGVLAELGPTPPAPAHFKASGLNIVPSVEKTTFVTKTGESVTITANVANDGGQEGDCTVVLKLNGETVDTKTVTLGAGQSKPVSFTRSGLAYGQYDVEVNELSDEFTASRTINWWLIIGIIVAIGLIIWGVVWSRRRRRKAHQEA